MDIESTLTSWSDNTWPDYSPDQILPGLFQGGTQDEEVLGFPDGPIKCDDALEAIDPAQLAHQFMRRSLACATVLPLV